MDSQQEKPSPPPERPSFFGLPASWHLWAGVGPTFWGGLLAGLGLGLFVAAWLADLGVQKTVWVGFIAIVLVGIGPGIALRAVRRNWQPDKDKPQNP
jgi:predicted lipid-binding transport protein (Tim44 family)